METTYRFLLEMAENLLTTLYHNGPWLFTGIFVAVLVTVYVDAEKLRHYLMRKNRFMIPGSVGFGALTPFCACGTMAVILPLVAVRVPWGPIMAFLVSSPLMSPETFVMFAGISGYPFALALLAASIVLGLAAGYLAGFIEKKTHLLKDQFRSATVKPAAAICNCRNEEVPKPLIAAVSGASILSDSRIDPLHRPCCLAVPVQPAHEESFAGLRSAISRLVRKYKFREFLKTFYNLGFRKILPWFCLFVVLSWLIKEYIPTTWITALFSSNNFWSVPLASLIGLPLYVSDASVAPLLQTLREAGASEGSMLAFMITGPATSIAVIGGLSVVMKPRAIALYLSIIFLGAMLLGYLYDLLLSL